MAKYLFTYTGGSAPTSPEEGARVMQAWVSWFGTIGAGVVDMGNPTGPTRTVAAGGVLEDASGPTGYSIIDAESFDAAVAHAQGCPVLGDGGSVQVSAVQEMV